MGSRLAKGGNATGAAGAAGGGKAAGGVGVGPSIGGPAAGDGAADGDGGAVGAGGGGGAAGAAADGEAGGAGGGGGAGAAVGPGTGVAAGAASKKKKKRLGDWKNIFKKLFKNKQTQPAPTAITKAGRRVMRLRPRKRRCQLTTTYSREVAPHSYFMPLFATEEGLKLADRRDSGRREEGKAAVRRCKEPTASAAASFDDSFDDASFAHRSPASLEDNETQASL